MQLGWCAGLFVIEQLDDQRGQSTWSYRLAEQLVALTDAASPGRAPAGVYHGTASGGTTWYDLARAVFTLRGLDPERIRPLIGDASSPGSPSALQRPVCHTTVGLPRSYCR